MNFLFPYSETKLKPFLKMAIQRVQLANNKRSTSVKLQKKGIAELLENQKEEKACIKVEHIIREDFTTEGYEILELLMELIHERIRQITNSKDCPKDLEQAVCSIIWAAENVDIDELREIKNQLGKKFGSEFVKKALANEKSILNPRLLEKLSYKPPSAQLVLNYLQVIAESYKVQWTPSPHLLEEIRQSKDAPFASPSGNSVPMAPASGMATAYEDTSSQQQGNFTSAAELEEHRQFLRHQQGSSSSYVVPAVVYPQSALVEAKLVQDDHNLNAYSTPSLPSAPAATTSVNVAEEDPIAALQARLAALNRNSNNDSK